MCSVVKHSRVLLGQISSIKIKQTNKSWQGSQRGAGLKSKWLQLLFQPIHSCMWSLDNLSCLIQDVIVISCYYTGTMLYYIWFWMESMQGCANRLPCQHEILQIPCSGEAIVPLISSTFRLGFPETEQLLTWRVSCHRWRDPQQTGSQRSEWAPWRRKLLTCSQENKSIRKGLYLSFWVRKYIDYDICFFPKWPPPPSCFCRPRQ